jgi:hypothetical protein
MDVFLPLPDELTPASDTSNTVSIIGELCLKSPMKVVCVRLFLREKPKDHLLLVFPPTGEIYTQRTVSILTTTALSG